MRLKKHEIAKITGIPSRRILEWTQKKYLIPAEPVPGKGKTSFYSPADAVWAKVLGYLFDSGVSIAKFIRLFEDSNVEYDIEDVINKLNPFYQKSKPQKLIIIDDFKHVAFDEYKGKYKTLIMINLAELKKEVRDALS